MSNKILFIFEGAKTEGQIVKNLLRYYRPKNTLVQSVFGTVIYELGRQIAEDPDLDTFQLLKEKNPEVLKHYSRQDFAEIYLFFDYDGHTKWASDDKLKSYLDIFDDETDKGKLYVSYPMVESLKHICDYKTFDETTIRCKEDSKYKNLVHKCCLKELQDFTRYTKDIWHKLIECHLKKMYFITNSSFEFPQEIINQKYIFIKQLDKFIKPHKTVGVLSAFPVFIHDYYGNAKTKQLLGIQTNESVFETSDK